MLLVELYESYGQLKTHNTPTHMHVVHMTSWGITVHHSMETSFQLDSGEDFCSYGLNKTYAGGVNLHSVFSLLSIRKCYKQKYEKTNAVTL